MAKISSGRPKVDITPTLVIGLGGTGMRVLSLFKQRILTVCDAHAPVAFFGIDTDEERLPGAALGTGEFANCVCDEAPDIVAQVETHEDIARWWIPGVKPGQIRKGAKMKRIIGRLACYANFSLKIAIPLRKHITSLTKQQRPAAKNYNIRRDTIRVYVVGSLSGGTGGGFFYDIAVAVRDAIGEVAGVGLDTCVAGIIVQPTGFIDAVPMDWQRQKVRANFYAALREIEHLHHCYEEIAKPESELAIWLAGKPARLKTAPFDWIYLVDTRNEKSQNISMPQLWDMIASNLCLEVYSTITNDVEESILSNVTRNTPYASFATASLRVPVQEILDYSALRLATEVLDAKAVKAKPEETDETHEMGQFFSSLGLFEAGSEILSSTLLQEAKKKGNKTAVKQGIPRQNADQAIAVANQELKALQAEKKGLNSARVGIANTAAAKAAQVEKNVGQMLEKMLSDANHAYGLDFLIKLVRQVRDQGSGLCQELGKQAAAVDPAVLEERIDPAFTELRQTVNQQGSWVMSWLDRGRSTQVCYENWAATVNTWAQAALKRCALLESAKVFQRVQEVANRLLASLKQIGAQLGQAAERCSRDAELVAGSLQSTSAQHVLVTNVVSGGELPRIYEQLKQQVDAQDFVPLVKPKPDRSLDWVNVRIEDLDGTLKNALLPAIKEKLIPHVQAMNVFQTAEQYWDGSVKQWVKDALAMCFPFCNWHRAKVPVNVFSATYLGTEDPARQKAMLGDIDETKVRLAATGDPHEIVIHALTAGYPASAVAGLGPQDEYRFFYELYCQKAKKDPNEHVHIDKRWLKDGVPIIGVID